LAIGGGAAAGPAVAPAPVSCAEGLVLDTYTGGCVAPIITRNIYVYAAPQQQAVAPAPVDIPAPSIDYNIVFVRTPEAAAAAEPIIVPPPQQRTLVYVLSKKQTGGQQVIEVPAGPASNPEVYFVNYGPGENPQLPGGVDLQSALGAAASAPGSLGGVGTGRADPALNAGAGLGGSAALSAPSQTTAFVAQEPSTGGSGAGQSAGGFGGQGFGGIDGFGGVGLGGVGGGVPLQGGQNLF